jgi:hypothetical protein
VDTIPLADLGSPSVVPGATPLPTASNVCEFCGQTRDPATGACACSVGAPGGYGAPDPYAPAAGPGYGGGYGGPAYAGQPGGAYAATVMDPGPGYGAGPGTGPCLVATGGPYAGQSFALGGTEMGIGRDPGQELALPGDTTASRRHARFYLSATGWVLRDEGSANGTWVNGVRIHEQPLFPGDEIRVGQSQFRFQV